MTHQAIGGPLIANGKRVPVSKAVRAGDFVFVSGQLAFDAEGNIVDGDTKAQTRKVMENLAGILKEAECTMNDIVKCTVWITDAAAFSDFNEVYGEFFTGGPPARSCIPSQLLLEAKVEIEAVAYKPHTS